MIKTLIINCKPCDRVLQWTPNLTWIAGGGHVILDGAYPTACPSDVHARQLAVELREKAVEIVLLTDIPRIRESEVAEYMKTKNISYSAPAAPPPAPQVVLPPPAPITAPPPPQPAPEPEKSLKATNEEPSVHRGAMEEFLPPVKEIFKSGMQTEVKDGGRPLEHRPGGKIETAAIKVEESEETSRMLGDGKGKGGPFMRKSMEDHMKPRKPMTTAIAETRKT